MIDRLVHHAEVVALKGDSYRLRNRDLGRVSTAITEENSRPRDHIVNRWKEVKFSRR